MPDTSQTSKPAPPKPASKPAPSHPAPKPSRRGSGPRTAPGKAASARNALRHGLSLPICADPATAAAVEALTRQIIAAVGPAIDPALAQAVAEAQIDLVRVRRARNDLIAAALIDHGDTGEFALRLAAMSRYERRAFSRRKFAIRAFRPRSLS